MAVTDFVSLPATGFVPGLHDVFSRGTVAKDLQLLGIIQAEIPGRQ